MRIMVWAPSITFAGADVRERAGRFLRHERKVFGAHVQRRLCDDLGIRQHYLRNTAQERRLLRIIDRGRVAADDS